MTIFSKDNPWYLIWFHPKKAMRHISKSYPTRYNHLLAILGAFTHVVAYTINWYTWWLTAIIWICLSIFSGLFMLYVLGGLLKWTGSWLKGKGSHQDIRSAIAWSQIPVIAFFIIDMIVLAIVGGNGSNVVYASILFVFSIWAVIIFLCCLAEAHQFSFVRALINYVMSGVIVLAVIVIIMMIATAFAPDNGTVQTIERNT